MGRLTERMRIQDEGPESSDAEPPGEFLQLVARGSAVLFLAEGEELPILLRLTLFVRAVQGEKAFSILRAI
jgi:hypothetical protein